MNIRVLVMGLPGSGKTELSRRLLSLVAGAVHLNADAVRQAHNDWDFSDEGRLRQALRMRAIGSAHNIAIADFVCPTPETRQAYEAHLTVFLNTIERGRFEDTNSLFVKPGNADFVIDSFAQVEAAAQAIADRINSMRPQGVMIGRFQPFHGGHRALFLEALKRSGFVSIMVRDLPRSPSNPLPFAEVKRRINEALGDEYAGRYQVVQVPNISGVYYGRDVGYEVERISLAAEIESISATEIRKAQDIRIEDAS